MQLHELKPKTQRKSGKRVGRGGKRGFSSGGGTKGQKGRAGASVRLGFRGGDNRIWQLFPKQRGASHKPGNSRPHRKHKYYQLTRGKAFVLSLQDLNVFKDGETVTKETLFQNGLIPDPRQPVKLLSNGELKRKLTFSKKEIP